MATPSTKFPHPEGLNAVEIRERCRQHCVPVNTTVNAAIEAHRAEFAQFRNNPSDKNAEESAVCALRAVVLAASREAAHDVKKLHYLSGLPEAAWESEGVYTNFKMRADTLAIVRRHLESW